MSKIARYVGAFVFNTEMTKVLLIKKDRPEWQKGSVNGVGGKVKDGETLDCAMRREWREETGLEADVVVNLNVFCVLSGPKAYSEEDGTDGFEVWWYTGFAKDNVLAIAHNVDETEPLMYVPLWGRFPVCLPNVPWLTYMAMSFACDQEHADYMEVREGFDINPAVDNQPISIRVTATCIDALTDKVDMVLNGVRALLELQENNSGHS